MKFLLRLAILISLIGVIALAVFISKSIQPDSLPTNLPTTAMRSAFARIAIIGDSWVARKGLDAPLTEQLINRGLRISVTSQGIAGANTRQIYRKILLKEHDAFPTSSMLSYPGARYCVIIAGVNDVVGHLGPAFYAHHVLLMSKLLLAYGITPIVVEIPYFEIESVHGTNIASTIKRFIFRQILDSGKVNAISDYRNALLTKLKDEDLGDSILIIRPPLDRSINNKLHIYSDPAHLNSAGYHLLAEVIAATVSRAQEQTPGT